MIITVEKFREYVNSDLTDSQIKEKLSALESLIRARTNNNFQKRNRRCAADVINGEFVFDLPIFQNGDTIEISNSEFNSGLYVVGDYSDADLMDEMGVIATKIYYPPDVQMGVIECLKWILKNELQNSGDKTNAPIASETISRHSVSYATDSTESDIDSTIGVPRKLTAFLIPYVKARF